MHDNFGLCLEFTLRYEGGYGDDPRDPGGPTNFGITQRTLGAWRGHPVTANDVRILTVKEAGQIYSKNYWVPSGADVAPLGCDLVLFDDAVNAGVARAKSTAMRAGNMNDASAFIRKFSDLRLSFLQGLRTWSAFGRGWGARVGACESLALKMATKGQPAQHVVLSHAAAAAQQQADKRKAGAVMAGGVAGATITASQTSPASYDPDTPSPPHGSAIGWWLTACIIAVSILAALIWAIIARAHQQRADVLNAGAALTKGSV